VGKARRGRGDERDSDRQRQGPKSERLEDLRGRLPVPRTFVPKRREMEVGVGPALGLDRSVVGTVCAPFPCYCGIVMEDMEGYWAGLDCTNCDFVFGPLDGG
jgi:hypothetical protein